MDKNQLLTATLESGIPPIETKLIEIRSTATRQQTALRSVQQLNTQQLGILLPEDFDPVATRTNQCVNLALANISDVAELLETASERKIKLDFISVSCPVRMIARGDIAGLLNTAFFEENIFLDPTKLCLEFPPEILLEDSAKISEKLSELRFMGIKTAIRDFGNAFCPTMRLREFAFDYAILDQSVTDLMENDATEHTASSLVSFVRGLGIEAVAVGATGNEIISRFYQSDCTLYIPEPNRLLSPDEALPDKS